MDGRLSLRSWLTHSGRLTHEVVTRQPLIRRRWGKVRQAQTDVLTTEPRRHRSQFISVQNCSVDTTKYYFSLISGIHYHAILLALRQHSQHSNHGCKIVIFLLRCLSSPFRVWFYVSSFLFSFYSIIVCANCAVYTAMHHLLLWLCWRPFWSFCFSTGLNWIEFSILLLCPATCSLPSLKMTDNDDST